MAINLDTQVGASAAPERLNRHNAQARQERWMAQLQDALFVHAPQAARAPAPAEARSGVQGRDEPAARQYRQRSGCEAGQLAAAGAAFAAMAQGPAAQARVLPGAPAAQAGAAPAAASAFALALRWSMPAPQAQAPQETGAPAVTAPRASSGLALAAGLPAEAHAPATAEAAEAAQDAGAAAADEQEQYARRLLHVYQDQDGVQAWLRDAALTPAQAVSVAAALAGELAGEGQSLAALTINGKRMDAGALRRAADAARGAAHFESITAGSELPAHQPGKV